ncbi:MAG TPA: hypothetical protein VIP09_02150 [Dehalococcoidia bacterium]
MTTDADRELAREAHRALLQAIAVLQKLEKRYNLTHKVNSTQK